MRHGELPARGLYHHQQTAADQDVLLVRARTPRARAKEWQSIEGDTMNPILREGLPPLPPRMTRLALDRLAWVAGFIEGEGSFTHSGSFGVVASQVQLLAFEKLQRLFGGTITKKGKPPKSHHRQCYTWYLHGYKAAALAMTLWTLMSPRRREQIERALTKWKKQQLPQSLRTHCPHGHPLRLRKDSSRRECPICQRTLYVQNRTAKRRAGYELQQPYFNFNNTASHETAGN